MQVLRELLEIKEIQSKCHSFYWVEVPEYIQKAAFFLMVNLCISKAEYFSDPEAIWIKSLKKDIMKMKPGC